MSGLRTRPTTLRDRGCYAPTHIAADADRIRGWLRTGKDVFVYYNNDIEGYAVDNVRQLIEAIETSKRPNVKMVIAGGTCDRPGALVGKQVRRCLP